jgi:hypothetical protein
MYSVLFSNFIRIISVRIGDEYAAFQIVTDIINQSEFCYGMTSSDNETVKARAKVVWDQIRVLKQDGGCGHKRLEDKNKVAILRRIWNLFAKAGSMCVAWVKEYLLKVRSFWQVKVLQI